MPNFEIGFYSTNNQDIVGCATGPSGGLTTVQRIEKHLSIIDSDIDFIDTQEETGIYLFFVSVFIVLRYNDILCEETIEFSFIGYIQVSI